MHSSCTGTPPEILQSEPLTVNTSAFVSTNPTGELITSGLLANREAKNIKIVFICLSGVRKSLRP